MLLSSSCRKLAFSEQRCTKIDFSGFTRVLLSTPNCSSLSVATVLHGVCHLYTDVLDGEVGPHPDTKSQILEETVAVGSKLQTCLWWCKARCLWFRRCRKLWRSLKYSSLTRLSMSQCGDRHSPSTKLSMGQVPLVQHITIIDVPVVKRHQVPTIVRQSQQTDRVVDVLIVTQQQVPMFQKAQKTAEFPHVALIVIISMYTS